MPAWQKQPQLHLSCKYKGWDFPWDFDGKFFQCMQTGKACNIPSHIPALCTHSGFHEINTSWAVRVSVSAPGSRTSLQLLRFPLVQHIQHLTSWESTGLLRGTASGGVHRWVLHRWHRFFSFLKVNFKPELQICQLILRELTQQIASLLNLPEVFVIVKVKKASANKGWSVGFKWWS